MTDAPALDLTSEAHAAPFTLVEQGQKIRPFDFFHKETIDRSHLRHLSGLFESICHRFASAASSEIRQSVRFETDITEVDPQTWEQYATTLPEVTYISSAVVLQLDGRIVMHAATAVALQFLDYYFGGDGGQVPTRDQLTDLEREIFSLIFEVIWEALPSAFGGLMEVSIGAIQHSTNALRLQSIRPNEMCLVIRFTVKINDQIPMSIDMVVPLEVIEPIITRLEEQQLAEFGRSGGSSESALVRLEATPTEVRASYPTVMLAAEEILQLTAGQVITLKEGVEPPPVQLVVGDTVIATASVEHDDDPMICRILSLEV